MMNKETRSITAEGMELRSDENGTRKLVGYMATFDTRSQDLGGFVEIIAPTAFNRTLGNENNDVVITYNHNTDNLLARRSGSASIEVDEVGVRYEVDLDPEDPLHKRIERMLVRGDLTGSSFTFSVTADGQEWSKDDDGTRVRTITQCALYEGGPVCNPAYLDSGAAIRSLEDVIASEDEDEPVEDVELSEEEANEETPTAEVVVETDEETTDGESADEEARELPTLFEAHPELFIR